MANILRQLKLSILKIRRKQNRLILMYKALAEITYIPRNDLHKPTRHNHPHSFRQLHTRSDVYKYSFVPNTIRDWNALPSLAFNDLTIAPEQLERFTNYVRNTNFLYLASAWCMNVATT